MEQDYKYGWQSAWVLFNIMHKDCLLAKIVCAISHQKMELAGFAFVDDTDLCAIKMLEDMETIQKNSKIGNALGGVTLCYWQSISAREMFLVCY